MGTRSFIILLDNEIYKGIYCHWDGYLEHNGLILKEHYSDKGKLLKLINKGDMSVLAETVEECDFYEKLECEDNTRPTKSKKLNQIVHIAEGSGCEYVYLFAGDTWSFASRGPQFFGGSDGTSFTAFKSLDEHLKLACRKTIEETKALVRKSEHRFLGDRFLFHVALDELRDEGFSFDYNQRADTYTIAERPGPGPYEVQHHTIADGWINTWSNDGKPTTFATPQEARKALDEFLAEITDQISKGERSVDDSFDPAEFRVRKVSE